MVRQFNGHSLQQGKEVGLGDQRHALRAVTGAQRACELSQVCSALDLNHDAAPIVDGHRQRLAHRTDCCCRSQIWNDDDAQLWLLDDLERA